MISQGMAVAIARAVEKAGGDMDDVEDLIGVWERLERDTHARVDRMRHEARTVRCCCADGGAEPTEDGRCSSCSGMVGVSALLDRPDVAGQLSLFDLLPPVDTPADDLRDRRRIPADDGAARLLRDLWTADWMTPR